MPASTASRPSRAVLAAVLLGSLLLQGCSGDTGDSASGGPSDDATSSAASASASEGSASADPSGTADATASSADGGHDGGRDLDLSSPDALTVLVNKTHPLVPEDWAPEDLEEIGTVQLRAPAAQAAREMIAAAAAEGVDVVPVSGYRSYRTQEGTYRQWVAQYGQERADVASARPGHSEHQTGLAVDIGGSGACDLQVCFQDTPAAQWAAEHGPEYGFVLRFPWMEHETTGYWYESWHLRYLGREVAADYVASGAGSYEEYTGTGAAAEYAQE